MEISGKILGKISVRETFQYMELYREKTENKTVRAWGRIRVRKIFRLEYRGHVDASISE
jgi:hypothetical protein